MNKLDYLIPEIIEEELDEDKTISQDNEEPFTVFDELPEDVADTVLDYSIDEIPEDIDTDALDEFDAIDIGSVGIPEDVKNDMDVDVNGVIDTPDPTQMGYFEENSVPEEEIDDEGSTIIEDDVDFGKFGKQYDRDIKNKAKDIEKDIPLTKPTKKDINDKIINDVNKGVAEDDLKAKQQAYENAKKPTKYEKEARKAAGLDNEETWNKMSAKEKKKVEDAIDEVLKEQKETGDAKRKKEADKERVNKFFKPLQYERKVFANGRNRVLPKGTFMSPDGTEYYNPETETIEQVIEENPKAEEEVTEENTNNGIGGAIKDAATENVGYNLWDTIIKS